MNKNRTMNDYKLAGAWMRLCKEVIAKTWSQCSTVLSKSDCVKFETVSKRISALCSKAEDNMFTDFPHIENDALDVFYGSADAPTRTSTDAEQVMLMQRLIVEMFGDNWNRDKHE